MKSNGTKRNKSIEMLQVYIMYVINDIDDGISRIYIKT